MSPLKSIILNKLYSFVHALAQLNPNGEQKTAFNLKFPNVEHVTPSAQAQGIKDMLEWIEKNT